MISGHDGAQICGAQLAPEYQDAAFFDNSDVLLQSVYMMEPSVELASSA